MENASLTRWMRSVERASDELRRGRAALVVDGHVRMLVYALEHIVSSEQKGQMREGLVVMPKQTAAYVGYDTSAISGAAVKFPVSLHAGVEKPAIIVSSGQAVTLSDTNEMEEAARLLVRFTGLAPSALLVPVRDEDRLEDIASVLVEDIKNYQALKPAIEVVTPQAAKLPLQIYENTRIMAFRDTLTHAVHLALMIGDPKVAKAPLVRLHSSCLTGDVLGSLRCECGYQLRASLAKMAEEGAGVLLYLNQEGRGIGIANKLRAYGLQDQGLDTVDANIMLGFEPDERDFSIAAQILHYLNVVSLRLLTNNPQKVQVMREHGIHVEERVELLADKNAHNELYLDTKRTRMDHWL